LQGAVLVLSLKWRLFPKLKLLRVQQLLI
jgi:hypothetical protein